MVGSGEWGVVPYGEKSRFAAGDIMKWSWQMGRIAGIRVQMHWTFLILIAWVILVHATGGASPAQIVAGVLLVLAVFACIVLHELGHALTARRFGIQTRDITLLPIGGVARLERMPDEPWQEFLVAIAGPIVNVVIAAVLYVGLSAAGALQPMRQVAAVGGNFFDQLLLVNVFIVGFNLLPAFPMDGGRILRSLLALKLPYARATRIAATAGRGMAMLFGLAGLYIFNPFLLFIAIFVYLGAQAEAQQVEQRLALEGFTVRDAMMTRFTALPDSATLGDAAEELLAGAQQDFPVIANGRLVGVLSRGALVAHLRERGRDMRVGELAAQECRPAQDGESLEAALQRMRELRCNTLPVVRDGAIVGLLTLENVTEMLLVQGAGSGTRG
jgi:Zn-dependent protease